MGDRECDARLLRRSVSVDANAMREALFVGFPFVSLPRGQLATVADRRYRIDHLRIFAKRVRISSSVPIVM